MSVFSRGVLFAASLAALCALLVVFVLSASAVAATTIAGAGSGAGQVETPFSVAVDQSSGTLYVGDQENHRVDEFDPSKPAGERFVQAFGWGVRDGADEAQTCTALSGCLRGTIPPYGGVQEPWPAGQIRPYGGLVFDPANEDVYLSEAGDYRVEAFTPGGEFVLSFGKEVNKTAVAAHGTEAAKNVCTAASHDTCAIGVTGTGPGAFNHGALFPTLPIAIDPEGRLWVGDVDRLQEFGPAGAFLSELKLPGDGEIDALAIDPSGDFYVTSAGFAGVQKLKPSGEPIEALDAAGHPRAVTIDPVSGDLFVSDQANTELSGTGALLQYASTGELLKVFGREELLGGPRGNGLAFGDAEGGHLYTASAGSVSAVQSFTVPPPGPLVRKLSASPIHGTSATLNAILNSEGAETHYRFQYLTQAQFETDGNHFGVGTEETSAATLAGSFSEPEVSAPIAGLSGETDYRFRLLAENSNGKGNTEEPQATFTTAPPLRVDSAYATAVSATSATLNAEIDPLGAPSEYRFEYLTGAAYQQNVAAGLDPFTGAQAIPQPDGRLGPVAEDLTVSQSLQGLTAATTYRYRVTAHNSGGSRSSLALAFDTQALAPLALLDDRGWELVSPADKHGALFKPIGEAGVVQAAVDGSAISYLASNPTEADPQGYTNQVQVLSARGTSSWQSSDLSLPYRSATGLSVGVGQEYRFFSEDLSQGIVQPFSAADLAAISPDATEVTPFLRTNFPAGSPTPTCAGSCYRPVLTGAEGAADVPPGTKFAIESPGVPCTKTKVLCGAHFWDASANAEHILLGSQVGLTEVPGDVGGLYEWSAGAPPSESLQLISILPNNKPAKPEGTLFSFQTAVDRNVISEDGSRVVWGFSDRSHLYLRDVLRDETVQLDANQGGSGSGSVNAVFQGASPDGSRIFFTDTQALVAGAGASMGAPDLYECQIEAGEGPLRCHLTDLTPRSGAESADVQGVALGFSRDGSSIYFVADGVLAGNVGADGSHASPGQCVAAEIPPGSTCNLYVSRNGSVSFVATLSGADGPSWGHPVPGVGGLPGLTARVSSNGEWLAFMSQRPLTGYDNHDAVTGEPDEEVFLYHAGTGSLVCASCNPTGARPFGVEAAQIDASTGRLAGGFDVWPGSARLAASIPGWTPYSSGSAVYQARYLSNGGRLFFNASDALAPKDSNGVEDVYEYEPAAGAGATTDTCSETDTTFSSAAGGCIDLISSGTSEEESAFLDASESGDDVFFLTAARLAPRDEDGAIDVYDARVAGGEPQPTRPVQCEGDGCQQPATPPVDATPGSLTFEGPGNLHETPTKKKSKHQKKHKHHHPQKKRRQKQPGTGTSRKGGNK
jgi:hypothetical protein